MHSSPWLGTSTGSDMQEADNTRFGKGAKTRQNGTTLTWDDDVNDGKRRGVVLSLFLPSVSNVRALLYLHLPWNLQGACLLS